MAVNDSTLVALECTVGLGRVSVPTQMIELVGEYEVGTRLPFSDHVSYAVGTWDGDVILSIRIARPEVGAKRSTRGLILMTPGSSIRWAFEITNPLGLVTVASLARAQSSTKPWLRSATLERGDVVQFVDLGVLVSSLDPGFEAVRA